MNSILLWVPNSYSLFFNIKGIIVTVIIKAYNTPMHNTIPNDAIPLYDEKIKLPKPNNVVSVVRKIAFPTLENK